MDASMMALEGAPAAAVGAVIFGSGLMLAAFLPSAASRSYRTRLGALVRRDWRSLAVRVPVVWVIAGASSLELFPEGSITDYVIRQAVLFGVSAPILIVALWWLRKQHPEAWSEMQRGAPSWRTIWITVRWGVALTLLAGVPLAIVFRAVLR